MYNVIGEKINVLKKIFCLELRDPFTMFETFKARGLFADTALIFSYFSGHGRSPTSR